MSTDLQDTRPCKRPRTEVAEDDSGSGSSPPQKARQESSRSKVETTLGGFERSTEFWFEDGSIVLVAQSTGFRVYRALLATQSTIFSDMFSSSTPNAEEMFEGCPVVHLSEFAADVAHFLRVLLPTSRRTLFSRDFSFSFDQISAIIRLAHKYDIQDVLDQALASLDEVFPSDFETWERTNNSNKQVVDVTPAQSISVVNLARLVDRPSLLPVALYRCALLGSTVLDGYERPDGTVEHLHPHDLRRAMRGRNRLARDANGILAVVFIADPCVECTTFANCRDALRPMLEAAIVDQSSSSPEILDSWECGIKDWGEEHGLCARCQTAAVERDISARRGVWDSLPKLIFDLHVDFGSADAEGHYPSVNDVISYAA